jgi:hypothetical protein
MVIKTIESAVRCSECEGLNTITRENCIWCGEELEHEYG